MPKNNNDTQIAVLNTLVDGIKEKIASFVTLDRFTPIEKIVWTITLLIITSVIGAILSFALRNQ